MRVETIILQQWLSDHEGEAMMKSVFLIYFYYPCSSRSVFLFLLYILSFICFSHSLDYYFFYPVLCPFRRRYLSPSP